MSSEVTQSVSVEESWLSGSYSCNNPPNRRKDQQELAAAFQNQTCLLFHPSTAVHVVRHLPASHHEASNLPIELAGSGIYSDSKSLPLMPRVNEVKRPQVRPRVFSKKRNAPLSLEVTQEPHGTDSQERGWPPAEGTLPISCFVSLAPSTHQ